MSEVNREQALAALRTAVQTEYRARVDRVRVATVYALLAIDDTLRTSLGHDARDGARPVTVQPVRSMGGSWTVRMVLDPHGGDGEDVSLFGGLTEVDAAMSAARLAEALRALDADVTLLGARDTPA